ncbi:MAG TPA: mechanosensitive ion channel family protein [Saprospiraceae bacterium]|nr:mechanosensitive ion channel family protein [Saprospiraceae bacterium]
MKDYFLEHMVEILTPMIVIIITLLIVFLFNKLYFVYIRKNTQLLKNNPTTYSFLGYFIKAILYLTGIGMAIYTIPTLRGVAASMMAGAGILALAIGFASQQALANIISGFFIVIFKPFKVNDRVIFRDTMMGVVEDITLRHTVIRNMENRRIVVPNSILGNEVLINADLGDQKICRFLDVGISYDSDIDKAKQIMFEEVRNHKDYFDNRKPEDIEKGVPEVTVRVISLGDSSVNLRAWVWAENTPVSFPMFCDLMESIKKRFDREGIEIPFPHRTLVQKTTKPTEKS